MCFHKVNICHRTYVSCDRLLMSDMLLLILAVNLAVNASVCFAMNMSTGMSQYVSIYVSWHVSECFFLGISEGVIFCIHISNVCRKLDCHHLPSFAIGSLTSGRSSRQDHSLSLWICKATLQTASARGQKKQGDSPSYSWRRSCYQLWGPNFQKRLLAQLAKLLATSFATLLGHSFWYYFLAIPWNGILYWSFILVHRILSPCVSHGQGNQQGKQRKQPQIWDWRVFLI